MKSRSGKAEFEIDSTQLVAIGRSVGWGERVAQTVAAWSRVDHLGIALLHFFAFESRSGDRILTWRSNSHLAIEFSPGDRILTWRSNSHLAIESSPGDRILTWRSLPQPRSDSTKSQVSKVEEKRGIVKLHQDLEVYQLAFAAAMEIFELSKKFPVEERYSLTDQIRRSSRSVCANLAEAWRKRRLSGAENS